MLKVILGMCSPAARFWLGGTAGEIFSHAALSRECEAAVGVCELCGEIVFFLTVGEVLVVREEFEASVSITHQCACQMLLGMENPGMIIIIQT